jgi:hypothetical protein
MGTGAKCSCAALACAAFDAVDVLPEERGSKEEIFESFHMYNHNRFRSSLVSSLHLLLLGVVCTVHNPVMLSMLANLSPIGIRWSDVASALTFDHLSDLLPTGEMASILSTDERIPLYFDDLYKFVVDVFPHILERICSECIAVPNNRGHRLRLSPVVPNGPEAAALLLAFVHSACCAPINHGSTSAEVEDELLSFKTSLVVVLDHVENSHVLSAAAKLGLPVAVLTADKEKCGLVTLSSIIAPSTTNSNSCW